MVCYASIVNETACTIRKCCFLLPFCNFCWSISMLFVGNHWSLVLIYASYTNSFRRPSSNQSLFHLLYFAHITSMSSLFYFHRPSLIHFSLKLPSLKLPPFCWYQLDWLRGLWNSFFPHFLFLSVFFIFPLFFGVVPCTRLKLALQHTLYIYFVLYCIYIKFASTTVWWIWHCHSELW